MKIITCEYVSPRRHTVFDIPLTLVGTDFQKRVWNALGGVPYGETRTYSDIAAAARMPQRNELLHLQTQHRRLEGRVEPQDGKYNFKSR